METKKYSADELAKMNLTTRLSQNQEVLEVISELNKLEIGEGLFIPLSGWFLKSEIPNYFNGYFRDKDRKFSSRKSELGYILIRTK